MIPELKNFLLENSAAWGLPAGGEWNCLFHNNYHPHYSGINLLWFRNSDSFPKIVTKICRDPDNLRREYRNLAQLYPGLSDIVPEPLHFAQAAGFWTLWMRGSPGSRFQVSKHDSPEILGSLVETVILMHAASRKQAVADDMRFRRMVSEPIDAVLSFGSSPSIRTGCETLAGRISTDWVESLPVIPQHGDLYTGNLLSDGKRWHIIDCETFGTVDLPLYDLLTLSFSLLHICPDVPEIWPYSAATEIAPQILRYSREFALSQDDVRLLTPLTLLNWFHLQWADGRQDFAERMYKVIEHYFQNTDKWDALIDARNGDGVRGQPADLSTGNEMVASSDGAMPYRRT